MSNARLPLASASADPGPETAPVRRRVLAGWGLTDLNGHLRNVAYLDLAADTRLLFFAAHGFHASTFAALRFGPAMQRDELEYRREVRLLDHLEVDLLAEGLAQDGSRFRLRNRFHREDGALAAQVLSTGGWLDLESRRLIAPPPALREALWSLPRTAEFAELPSCLRPGASA